VTYNSVSTAEGTNGGGVVSVGTHGVDVRNSIIYWNLDHVDSTERDCMGLINSQGFNMFGPKGCPIGPDDVAGAWLGASIGPRTTQYGGLTATHPLVPGSPAIDAGDPAGCGVPTDQRGVSRAAGGRCDAGAFEFVNLDSDDEDDCADDSTQPNADGDSLIDVCDADDDNDGALDEDNVDPLDPFSCRDDDLDLCDDCTNGAYDTEHDGTDTDADGLCDLGDNCPTVENLEQFDWDLDGVGDPCDNCPAESNWSRDDLDLDGQGDRCDLEDGLIYMTLHRSDRVTWQEEIGFDSWNSYRGDLNLLRTAGAYTQDPSLVPLASRSCDLPEPWTDDADPPAGAALFFLTTGNYTGTTVESGLGADSEGLERPNSSPCP
jgi:hypothetical protein